MTRPLRPGVPAPNVAVPLSGVDLIRQRLAPQYQALNQYATASRLNPLDPAARLQSITNQGNTMLQASVNAKVVRDSPGTTTYVDPITGQRKTRLVANNQNLTNGRLQARVNRPAQPQQQGSVGQFDNPKYNQMAQWARQAGWADKDIPTLLGIIMAESGGRPEAVNRKNANGSIDTGLAQINSIHRNGAARGLNLFDPVQNLTAALNVYKGSGSRFTPWVTYNEGLHQPYVRQPSGYVAVKQQPFVATTPNGGVRSNALSIARGAIGVPYVWGGNSLQKGVDCSGLVQQTYKQLGISLPRTANQQSLSAMGTRTTIANLQPGDLVAWAGNRAGMGPGFVGHIAIYAGNGRIIEAPSAGMTVRERSLRPGENVFGVALNFA